MKKMKTILKHFAPVLAAAAALFTACGEDGISDIIRAIAGGKPPASDELKLKTLTVYYSEDEDKTNLVIFNPSKGDYTITDVVNNKGTLTVEAEAQKTAAETSVSWSRGAMTGKSDPVENEPATLTNIPVPGIEGGQNLNTVITVTVRNGGQSYPYTITAKAPGVDSSLKYLSFRYEDGNLTSLSDLEWENDSNFWNGELLYDKNLTGSTYTAFDGSSQYVLELPAADKDKAKNANVAITALASDGYSVIELTVNGVPVEPELEKTPEIPAAAAVFREEIAGEDGGLGEDGEEIPPAETVEALNHRWLVEIPPAGGEALTIALKVTNDTVFSAYTITLVPPPDNTDNTDTRLLNIQFKDADGKFIIPQSSEAGGFNSGTSTYQFAVTKYEGPFTIESCAPSHANANVAITYTEDGGEPQSIPYPAYGGVKIPKPGADKTTVVRFRVTINGQELTAREYSVTLTNPADTFVWKGTVELDGSGKSDYTITGLNVITSGNTSHTVAVNGGNWNIALGKKYADANNPPAAFTATLTKNEDTGSTRYCVVENISDISPNTPYPLIFTVDSSGGTGGSAENPLYTMVYKASDLANMGATTNYYIANDIDLTELGSWTGAKNYAGHFNGGGNKIKLELSRTNGDTGLFNNLASGAIIENLNVEVSTENDEPLSMNGGSHFGGVIGVLTSGSSYTIKGVKVRGSLKFTGGNNYLYVGGLIGEIQDKNSVTLTVDDCEADIEISGAITNSIRNGMGFGGLIGKNGINGGGVTIMNSSTRGKINLTNSTNTNFFAGGFIGAEGNDSGNSKSTYRPLVIENCYSSMEIVISAPGSAVTIAGGLIGSFYNGSTSSRITNSAAINPKVLAIASSNVYYGRVIGRRGNSNENLSTYALAEMLIGKTEPGAAITGDGAANSVNGLSKTAADFKNQATWRELNFSTDNWDFSNIAKDGYPTLKFK